MLKNEDEQHLDQEGHGANHLFLRFGLDPIQLNGAMRTLRSHLSEIHNNDSFEETIEIARPPDFCQVMTKTGVIQLGRSCSFER